MNRAPKRRGRPPSASKKIFITIPLPERCYRKLDAYARQKNEYKGKIIADLIENANLPISEVFALSDSEETPGQRQYAAAGAF